MAKSSILIVCFSFPPFPGIGGRRWAKFAKYLSEEGYEVHALGARNNSAVVSEWEPDVKNERIHLHTVPLGWTKVLSFSPETFLQKVAHKIFMKLMPRLEKGNPVDKVYFLKNRFLNKADELISKHGISTVIVTIPPYKLAYYLLPLKKKHPELKFIVDYRDPWTDNRSYHGFAEISSERLAKEKEYEVAVLAACDAIFDVNAESLSVLKARTANKAKFHHIPNGFDQADYASAETSALKKDEKIRFIYSGSFYPNLIYLLKPLIETVAGIKQEDPQLYARLEFNFYGNIDHAAKKLMEQSGVDVFNYHGSMSKTGVLQKIAQSDYCLLFSAFDHGAAFNTKFYEYLCFKKPIVYFGPEGRLADFIKGNNIGIVIHPGTSSAAQIEALLKIAKAPLQINEQLDVSDFDIRNITKKIISVLDA